MLAQKQKLESFLDMLEEYPEEAVAWFIFGRTPFLEKRLQYAFKIKYDYARNTVLSGRRVLDNYLPEKDTLAAPVPVPTIEDLQHGLMSYNMSVQQRFAEQLAQQKSLTSPQQVFKRRLETVAGQQNVIIPILQTMLREWNDPKKDTPASRWKLLKRTAREVQQILEPGKTGSRNKIKYFSVLRGILIAALLPSYAGGRTVLGLKATGILTVEHVITKPFSKRLLAGRPWRLPLTLLMGTKYVVERPGNATVLTELGKTQGSFFLKIFAPRHKKKGLTVLVKLSPSIRRFLAAGATITMLVLTSGPAPAYKLTVKIIMSGKVLMFFSRKAIDKTGPLVQTPDPAKLEAIGVDINRPGKDVVALSEPITLPGIILMLSNRYWHLETVIKELSRAYTQVQEEAKQNSSDMNKRHLTKIHGELLRVYARRKRLLQQLFHEAVRYLATVFTQTGCPLGCFEDLNLTARGTKGALAKAILSMLDDKSLPERVMLLYEWLTGKKLTVVLVDPRGTSQGEHVDCPVTPKGRLHRSGKHWDIVTCTGCKKQVDTQTNAARVIKLRGIKCFKERS